MDDFELAKAIFKQPKDTKTPRIVSGTAYTDSADGSVQVNIDGSVFELPTNVSVKDGDTVQVTLSDRSPVVTGVVGRGDEVEAEIGDARKVATNYIDYNETDGVVVGNMTEGTLGANTQICVEDDGGIDKATINLRDGSTVLAKFQDDSISLGVNSPTTEIDMCCGSLVITNFNGENNNIASDSSVDSLTVTAGEPNQNMQTIDLVNNPSAVQKPHIGMVSENDGTGGSSALYVVSDDGIVIDGAVNVGTLGSHSAGTAGQVLTSQGAGHNPVWTTPAVGGGSCDLIYDTPLYWWDSGAIAGTDSGSDDPSRAGMGYGELAASIEDYDLLVIHFKAGDTNSLNNTRLTHVLPVGAVEYISGSQIDSGTKAQEFMYLYPAANPSWFIDVAYGFTDATHVYAKRRTYGNIRYWNIDKIYGIKF